MRRFIFAILLLFSACVEARPGPVATAVESFRRAPATSVKALEAAAKRAPSIETALWTLEAEARLAAGDREGARRVAARVVARDARWAGRAAWVSARATDDCRAAIASLETAAPDPAWVPAAPRLALLADAQARCADAAAAEARRRLAIEHPHTPEGEAAARGLTFDEPEALARAEAFERARMYPEAQRALEALAGSDEARFRLAMLRLDRLRDDFRAAAAALEQVAGGAGPRAEEALYQRARALGRADDAGAAAAWEAYLGRYPEGAFAEDARFFRAFLDYERGRFAEAAAGFGAIAAGRWTGEARWYHAWSLFLARDPRAAAALDAAAAVERPGSEPGRRAAYWAARAREARDPAEARRRYAALLAEAPFDWYGMLVRRRHPALARSVAPPQVPPERPAPPLPKALRDEVDEVRLLARAGLGEFARRALARLDPALRKARAFGLLRELARAAGDWRRLAAVTEGRHDDLLRGVPGAGDVRVWRDAYPTPWEDAVGAAAKEAGIPPSLVTAFIRQESAFDPDAVSGAHAVGLMQLLPKTALRIVGERGRPASPPPPDLFRPEVNVELGAWYVGALSKRFGGQVPLVAAAYNAGPSSVLGWFRGRPTAPTDEFVESIPFKETRRYVRHLLRHFVTYRITRERVGADVALQALPLELDLTVRPGVDF